MINVVSHNKSFNSLKYIKIITSNLEVYKALYIKFLLSRNILFIFLDIYSHYIYH